MLLIVGGSNDAEARSAVAHLNRRPGPQRAALLDAADLSHPGWRLLAKDPHRGSIVAEGKVLPVSDLTGVLVRRLAVYPEELHHVHADDRAYVASEMTALLAWWLRVVPVPVLNRPASGMLCGPARRPEQWRVAARGLGFSVAPLRREATRPPILPAIHTEIVAVGEEIVGEAPQAQADCVLALSRDANVALLYAGFDEFGALVIAHALPRLSVEVIEAVERHVELNRESDRPPAEWPIHRMRSIGSISVPAGAQP
jgi:hypothetical protein